MVDAYLLTYSMVQSPCWEANWFAASQEIPRISRNPKVHYRTHKRPPPISILGQPNPVHIPTSHLLEIYPNIIHPSTPRSPQWSPSLRFPQQDPIHPPLLTHTRHMPTPPHSSRFYHPHNFGRGVQILYPQREDAPCRGDRDLLHGVMEHAEIKKKTDDFGVQLQPISLFNGSCVLCEVWTECLCTVSEGASQDWHSNISGHGSPRHQGGPTSWPSVRPSHRHSDLVSESGTGTGLSPSTSVLPCHHPTNAPYLFIDLRSIL